MTRTATKHHREASAGPASVGVTVGYDTDFFAWTQEQARLLREGRFSEIDIENVAEELETLGRSEKREIESRLQVLLAHLLEWRHQSAKRSNSWRSTIVEQRSRLMRDLKDSPSLRRYPREILVEEYVVARLTASGETKLPLEAFPAECPFTIEEILDPDFLPGESAA